jgi:hypothetical protein
MTTHEELQIALDFDRVIEVHADGTITGASGIYAPEMYDDHVEAPWTLMDGYSGQQSYRGPTMHASEYIGGRLADDILARPGYYVAVLSLTSEADPDDPEDNVAGWGIAYRPAAEPEMSEHYADNMYT